MAELQGFFLFFKERPEDALKAATQLPRRPAEPVEEEPADVTEEQAKAGASMKASSSANEQPSEASTGEQPRSATEEAKQILEGHGLRYRHRYRFRSGRPGQR